MTRKVIYFFVCCIIGFELSGQEPLPQYSKWYIKPAAGINSPVTNLLKGQLTDDLIWLEDNPLYLQFVSAAWFFSKRWGIEINFQITILGQTSKRLKRVASFSAKLNNKYGVTYFVDTGSSGIFDKHYTEPPSTDRGYLGIVYRMEKGKLLFMPKAFIGFTTITTDWARIYLKEKNSNNTFDVHFYSGQGPNDRFTIASSFTLGYKVTKRLIINMDLLYSYYKIKTVFTETTRNLNTLEITGQQQYNYTRYLGSLAAGAGLIIVIK